MTCATPLHATAAPGLFHTGLHIVGAASKMGALLRLVPPAHINTHSTLESATAPDATSLQQAKGNKSTWPGGQPNLFPRTCRAAWPCIQSVSCSTLAMCCA